MQCSLATFHIIIIKIKIQNVSALMMNDAIHILTGCLIVFSTIIFNIKIWNIKKQNPTANQVLFQNDTWTDMLKIFLKWNGDADLSLKCINPNWYFVNTESDKFSIPNHCCINWYFSNSLSPGTFILFVLHCSVSHIRFFQFDISTYNLSIWIH